MEGSIQATTNLYTAIGAVTDPSGAILVCSSSSIALCAEQGIVDASDLHSQTPVKTIVTANIGRWFSGAAATRVRLFSTRERLPSQPQVRVTKKAFHPWMLRCEPFTVKPSVFKNGGVVLRHYRVVFASTTACFFISEYTSNLLGQDKLYCQIVTMETTGSQAGNEFRVQGVTQDYNFPPGSKMRQNHHAYKEVQEKSEEANQAYERRAQQLFAGLRGTNRPQGPQQDSYSPKDHAKLAQLAGIAKTGCKAHNKLRTNFNKKWERRFWAQKTYWSHDHQARLAKKT